MGFDSTQSLDAWVCVAVESGSLLDCVGSANAAMCRTLSILLFLGPGFTMLQSWHYLALNPSFAVCGLKLQWFRVEACELQSTSRIAGNSTHGHRILSSRLQCSTDHVY